MNETERTETVIYGGAFKPPTRAHQAILQACIDYAEPRHADVWLMPSGSRLDKVIDMEREKRIALCTALTRDVVRRTVALAVTPIELDRTIPTETYDTVRELEAQFPERQFTWVFGADSVASMRTWDHGDWLYDQLSMLVIARPGTPLPVLGQRATHLAVEAGDYSSTELRRLMSAGEPFDHMVGVHVRTLLEARG